MSLERAKEYLKKYKLDNKILEFDTSSATVELAAKALNCKEEEIAKTMSFLVGEKPIVIVVAGDQKIDNAKYKQEFHTKAKMIPPELVEELIGHEIGGVCPFGVKENVDIYLDVSLKEHTLIHPACGTHNSAIPIEVKKLEEILDYQKWIDVCKDK
jgi:prolyl-tRNA editing enzyme YbaK/EbsC (Cys-tRNA(Pro) deacylase)